MPKQPRKRIDLLAAVALVNEQPTVDPDELLQAGVDVKVLQRAAFERRLAEEDLRGNPQQDAAIVALSKLVTNLRSYAGEPH